MQTPTLAQKVTVAEDVFTFDESIDPKTGKRKHDYMLNGKPLTGVTTILKVVGKGDALVQWSANQAVEYIIKNSKKNYLAVLPGEERVYDGYIVDPETMQKAPTAWKGSRDTAGDFGTNVHKAIEDWVKEGLCFPLLQEKEQKAFDNFKKWVTENGVGFLESEKRVYSKDHWYAGTLDLMIQVDGKIFLADIKTSSAIYPEHMWQMGGYDIALNEMTDKYRDIEGYIVINLKKNGTIDWKKSYDRDGNRDAFLACLKIYRKKEELVSALGKRTDKRNSVNYRIKK